MIFFCIHPRLFHSSTYSSIQRSLLSLGLTNREPRIKVLESSIDQRRSCSTPVYDGGSFLKPFSCNIAHYSQLTIQIGFILQINLAIALIIHDNVMFFLFSLYSVTYTHSDEISAWPKHACLEKKLDEFSRCRIAAERRNSLRVWFWGKLVHFFENSLLWPALSPQ